ncbi:MAG: hypothetical protein ABI538_06035 [Pseudoxanthomonas sp.]
MPMNATATLLPPLFVAWGIASAATAAGVPASPPPAAERAQQGDPAQYEQRDLPVTAQDLRILVRTGELLSDASAWNRSDDRECKDDEVTGKRSLFCALHAASIEILGSYDHRRVALQEVRFAIEQVTKGRKFEHRLMDFNNLPDTTLDDVHAVLRIARDRVVARLHPGGAGRP